MNRKQGKFLGFRRFSIGIALFCLAGILSCAQKQAEVEKLEMEMAAASATDSAITALDTSKEVNVMQATAADSQESTIELKQEDSVAAIITSKIAKSEQAPVTADTVKPVDTTTRAATDTESRFDPDQVPTDTEKEAQVRNFQPSAYTGSGGYTLQIASTDSRGYAEELVNLFKQRGYQPYITELSVDGVTRFRVRIGQYTNSIEAQQVLDELRQNYGVVGWVDRIR